MSITIFKKQKVDPYWPNDVGESLRVGDLEMKTEQLETSADYIIRTMTVKRGVSYMLFPAFQNVALTYAL